MGWVMDRCSSTDPSIAPQNIPILGSIIGMFPGVVIPQGITVPEELGYALVGLATGNTYTTLNPLLATIIAGGAPPPGEWSGAENDITGVVDSSGVPVGNGGGTTVYRLREGIERFMITDINNPAGSAEAQSSIFVMWDDLATNPSAFNHIPGGANVLYMDGHVTFMRYTQLGPAPANVGMATLTGILTSG
jgi:prepilin-type processing-associated H-X9-DG protein